MNSDRRVLQVNVSNGGVPKLPIQASRITRNGLEGDRQRAETVHGGPHRAVSILGIEAIRRVAAEGHPIRPGTTGENLTTEGFDVSTLAVGTRLAIGDEVVLEISQPTNPCRTIRHSFADLRFGRLSMKTHPADSRMYARVLASHRGRGIQRALITHRAEHARRLGANLVGASAVADGASAANLERLGFRRVGTRHSYRAEPSA